MKNPAANTLRTKEQLGYIVKTLYHSDSRVIGASITVQSSKYGPEYLESRINAFLKTLKDQNGPGKTFDDETVENIKKAEIQILSQVKISLEEEHDDNWEELVDNNNPEFDTNQKLVAALKLVTPELVNQKFEDLMFNNPKRLNIKYRSQNHKVDQKIVDENEAFYASLGCQAPSKIENVKVFRLQSQLFANK